MTSILIYVIALCHEQFVNGSKCHLYTANDHKLKY